MMETHKQHCYAEEISNEQYGLFARMSIKLRQLIFNFEEKKKKTTYCALVF